MRTTIVDIFRNLPNINDISHQQFLQKKLNYRYLTGPKYTSDDNLGPLKNYVTQNLLTLTYCNPLIRTHASAYQGVTLYKCFQGFVLCNF